MVYRPNPAIFRLSFSQIVHEDQRPENNDNIKAENLCCPNITLKENEVKNLLFFVPLNRC